MENNPETNIFSAGYADTFHGTEDISAEYSVFYEKEPDGTIGASNLYVLASGTPGTSLPEVSGRFTAKKILYEYFHNYDYVDANKLALAMRTANNEIYEYAKVQSDKMSASAIAAAVTDGKVAIATVGGCRAYIIRNGKVFQITEDPAVLDEKVQSGELSPEEAYGEGENAVPTALGLARDITTDIYDGIEVRSGDILLLCSASLDTFIGKKEILEAVGDNNARGIVQNLLELPALQNAGVPASVAAIRIFDNETVDTMIRVDGVEPSDTDLNSEKKDVELIRKNKPRKPAEKGKKKKSKLPAILLSILGALLLLGGGAWAASHFGLLPDNVLGSIFPPTETPTPTVDWVRESMTVYELTAEVEKAAAVYETVAAWPTQTPYPTYTPVFIDLEDPTETPVPEMPEDRWGTDLIITEDAGDDQNTDTGGDEPEVPSDQPVELVENIEEEPTATPEPTAVPTLDLSSMIMKDNYTDEQSGSEMIYIPAGTFLLGSDPEEDEYAFLDEESPQIEVNLDAYWIGKTEVTNGEYLRCVEAGVCEQNTYMHIYVPGEENNPLIYVTYDQAERFCSWIGGRLPTEYEWEKAARGTDGRIYPWGSEVPTLENDLANIPMYVSDEGYGPDIFPVGSFPNGASPYGALDMAGNVWEWTSTWYSLNYYQTLAAGTELGGSMVSNPTGPSDGSTRVIRGGSCSSTEINNYEAYMRAANRSYVNMSSSYFVGFRCVVPDLEDSGSSEPPLP